MPPIPLFIALADATRCRIVGLLGPGALPVHVLAASFDISRPAISRHLRVLKQAGIISEIKKGRENLYGLHPGSLEPGADWIAAQLPRGITIEAEEPSPDQTEIPPVAATTRPRKAPAISQMGFDF